MSYYGGYGDYGYGGGGGGYGGYGGGYGRDDGYGGGGYGGGGYGGGGYGRNDRFGGGGGGGGRGGWGGGGGGGRGGGGRGGWGGGGRGGRGGGGDRGRGGRGRGDRGRGGRGRGGGFKRNFGDGDRDPPSKRFRENEDNWEESDRHSLMQSLFMEAVPDNLEQDWLVVVCPPGKRRVVVAANDTTQTYNNAGATDLKFNSCLPSGSPLPNAVHKYDDLTILDAVYSAEKKKIYVIDLLHWKHYPYYDTEADFRHFCLSDKFSELKDPSTVTENNEYPLEVLQKHPATRASIEQILKAAKDKVEGLLFVNKNSHYVCHDSADSLWIKLDQMEKVLGIPVPEGVEYAHTNAQDEKRKAEMEERKKLRMDREAAKEKQDKEMAERKQAQSQDDGAADGGDNGGEGGDQTYDQEGYEQEGGEGYGQEGGEGDGQEGGEGYGQEGGEGYEGGEYNEYGEGQE